MTSSCSEVVNLVKLASIWRRTTHTDMTHRSATADKDENIRCRGALLRGRASTSFAVAPHAPGWANQGKRQQLRTHECADRAGFSLCCEAMPTRAYKDAWRARSCRKYDAHVTKRWAPVSG